MHMMDYTQGKPDLFSHSEKSPQQRKNEVLQRNVWERGFASTKRAFRQDIK